MFERWGRWRCLQEGRCGREGGRLGFLVLRVGDVVLLLFRVRYADTVQYSTEVQLGVTYKVGEGVAVLFAADGVDLLWVGHWREVMVMISAGGDS